MSKSITDNLFLPPVRTEYPSFFFNVNFGSPKYFKYIGFFSIFPVCKFSFSVYLIIVL